MPRSVNCPACDAPGALGDRYCADCGIDLSPRIRLDVLIDVGLDPGEIWLWEVPVRSRTAMLLARRGMYVVSDLAGVAEADLTRIRGLKPSTLDELGTALASLAEQADTVAADCAARAGTSFDPNGPALGVSFAATIRARGVDPTQVSVTALKLRPPTRSTLLRSGIGCLADLLALTNLELMRRLNLPSPRLLEELDGCAEAFVAQFHELAERVGSTPGAPSEEPAPPEEAASPEETRSGEGAAPEHRDDPVLDPATDAMLALLAAVGRLDDRRESVIRDRFGLDGNGAKTLEEIGQEVGVSRERVRQIEKRAIAELVAGRTTAAAAFEHAAAARGRLGLAWHDPRLSLGLAGTRPHPVWREPANLRLLLSVFDDRLDRSDGVSDVEDAVVVVLSQHPTLPLDELAAEVESMLDEDELGRFPRLAVAERIATLGPAVVREDGRCVLPEGPIAGVSDRRIRRLAAIRQVLEQHGPSHYSVIAREIESLLPPAYAMSERDVQAWIGRYPKLFVWAGRGVYGLPSQGVGVRRDVGEVEANDATAVDGRTRRVGIGGEIEVLLREHGAMPLHEVEEHVLPRFSVLPSSILAAIKQDKRRRFVLDADLVVSLRRDIASSVDAGVETVDERTPELAATG